MIKQHLVSAIYVISALLATESFAMDKMPKARSGEMVCIGGERNDASRKLSTNFVFRNLDPVNSIAFTKIELYKEDGALVTSMLPPDFPASFKATIAPYEMAAATSTELLSGITNSRLTLKMSFKTANRRPAIAPHGGSVLIDTDTNDAVISRDTVECVYTLIQ